MREAQALSAPWAVQREIGQVLRHFTGSLTEERDALVALHRKCPYAGILGFFILDEVQPKTEAHIDILSAQRRPRLSRTPNS